jgi:hypothetical protein
VVSAAPYAQGPNNTWLRRYLATGAGSAVDVLGVHLYSTSPEATVTGYQGMRRVITALGLGAKPVWDTETGFRRNTGLAYSLADQRGIVLRAFLLLTGQGIKRVYLYAWDDHGWVTLRFTGPDNRTMTPAGIAYQQAVDALTGAQVLSCSSSENGLSTCDVRQGSNLSRFYWVPTGTARVTLPPKTIGISSLGGVRRPAAAGQVVVVSAEPLQVALRP